MFWAVPDQHPPGTEWVWPRMTFLVRGPHPFVARRSLKLQLLCPGTDFVVCSFSFVGSAFWSCWCCFFFLNHPFKWSQVRVYPIQLIVRHRFIPSSSNLQPSVWPWPTSKQICPKSAQGIDLETGQDPLAEIGGSKSSHGGSRWVLAIGFTAASGRKIYHGHGKLPILLCSPHCVGVWPCQPSVLYRPEYSEVVHGLGTQEVAIKVYKTATKSVNSSEDSFYHSLMPLISHSLSKILQTTVVRYQ
jgi:hypothetical protein